MSNVLSTVSPRTSVYRAIAISDTVDRVALAPYTVSTVDRDKLSNSTLLLYAMCTDERHSPNFMNISEDRLVRVNLLTAKITFSSAIVT